MKLLNKKIVLASALFCTATLANADVANANANASNPNLGSNAVQFAIQAGSIAGPAEACGQDVSVFKSRVDEALNKLAGNPADKLAAATYFQKAFQQTRDRETTSHTIPCAQVAQDYNNLPIMRPDYQQTVIAQLNPVMGSATSVAPAASTGQANNAPNAQPVPNTTAPVMPNTQQQAPNIATTPVIPNNAPATPQANPGYQQATSNTSPNPSSATTPPAPAAAPAAPRQ